MAKMEEPQLSSALRVQRDSAHRQLIRVETENRVLRRHQAEIRTWLAEAVEKFGAARTSERVLDVADEIHETATAMLAEAQRLLGT